MHVPTSVTDSDGTDTSYMHHIVLGSLHSHVVSSNLDALEQALKVLRLKGDGKTINAKDEAGLSALHLACIRQSVSMVAALVKAGADVTSSLPDGSTFCHLCATRLDEANLSIVLASPTMPDPNVIDKKGRTPMYAAINATITDTIISSKVENTTLLLSSCLAALEAKGGKIVIPQRELNTNESGTARALSQPLMHSICHLAKGWHGKVLPIVLPYYHNELKKCGGASVGALLDYPIHACLLSLLKLTNEARNGEIISELKQFTIEPNIVM